MTSPTQVLTLPPSSRSAAAARRAVAQAIQNGDLIGILDEALLLVTELVTNAVVHAGTEVELLMTTTAQGLRVEVVDRSPGALSAAPDSPTGMREGGRGIFLLDAIASEWGTRHFPEGKAVWFQLGAGAPPPVHVPAELLPPAEQRDQPSLDWLLGLPADLEQRISSMQLIDELMRRLTEAYELDAAWLYAETIQDDATWELIATSDGAAVAAGPSPAHVRRLAQTGPVGVLPGAPTGLILPLHCRSGVCGALVVATTQALSPEQLAVARLIGDRMSIVLRDDRASASQRRSRGALALLAEASEMFAGTLDVQLALTLAAQFVVPRLATWAAVCTTYEESPQVVAVAHADETRLSSLRVAMSSPAGQSLAEQLVGRLSIQHSVLVPGDALPADVGDDGSSEVLALTLAARRRPLGLILVGRSVGSAYTPEDISVLTDLARRAGLAVDNARLYEERTGIARALQASLLPPTLPMVPGLEFGGRYAAAGEGNDVGGDFYDAFPLPGNRWGVAVGDVCGKGAEAAAITGMARDVLRLLVRDGAAPSMALQRLNESILELGERGRFCTAALGIVEPTTSGATIRLSTAGHPAPVLLHADGQASFVGPSGTLLGVVPDVELEEDEVYLAPGDALVFYTDGVTERRNAHDMFGDDRLLEAIRSAGGLHADRVAGHLEKIVQRFGSGPSRDDLAVLVVRCAMPHAAAPVAHTRTTSPADAGRR